jgi:hypothetical protein
VSKPSESRSLIDSAIELLSAKNVGDVVSYAEFATVGLDVPRRRPLILKAIDRHLEQRGLAASVVRAVGYQIEKPEETPRLIRGRMRRAHRQVGKGRKLASHVARDEMSSEARARVEALEVSMTAAQRELRFVKNRVERHEQMIQNQGRAIETMRNGMPQPLTADDMDVLKHLVAQYRAERPVQTPPGTNGA